jgi:hypothetical protein
MDIAFNQIMQQLALELEKPSPSANSIHQLVNDSGCPHLKKVLEDQLRKLRYLPGKDDEHICRDWDET